MIDPAHPDYHCSPAAPRRPRFDYQPVDPGSAPAVTIVTPFHNTGPEFRDTAACVLGQSLQQWEWLLVNDGSTDPAALALLGEYRALDPRIRVIDLPQNRGLSAARNEGFAAARTEYILQLDSDDLLEPTAAEKWWWFLHSYPQFAFVKGYTVGFGAQTYLWQHGFHDGRQFTRRNLVCPTAMVRQSVHTKVGGYDVELRSGLEDWEFWLRCASAGHWGATVPEYLDWYRRRPDHSDRWGDWDAGDRERAFARELRRRYPRLWRGAFPRPAVPALPAHPVSPDELPALNRLRKTRSRLLLITPYLTLGGADRFNLDLLDQLRERGWEVTVAAAAGGGHEWSPQFAARTPDVFVLNHFLSLADFPRFLKYLIGSRAPDVVLVAQSELGYLLLPYLRAHHPEATYVDFCHLEEDWKSGGHARAAVDYQELLDLNIAASHHLREWMIARGADPARVAVSHVNVPVSPSASNAELERAGIRRELGLKPEEALILYAARLTAQKQPRVFAETVRQLSRSGADFAALVAGEGEDGRWLSAYVRRHGLARRVRLLGPVPHERLQHLMRAADVFFLPSKWEGIALTVYEAMAAGLPVVTADVGGQRELVTGETGCLIAPEPAASQPQRYAAVLGQLLNDPVRRQTMGRAGRRRVETEFRLEQMGERMVSLFGEAERLRQEHPRPNVGLGLGRAAAAQAVEYIRRADPTAAGWSSPGVQLPGLPVRALAYALLRRAFLDWYSAGLARGLGWLAPVKDALKALLFR